MAPNTCRGLRPGSRDDIVSPSHIRHAHASDAHSPDAAHTRPVATPNLCPADRLGGARQPVRAVGARRSSTWWVDHEGEARLHDPGPKPTHVSIPKLAEFVACRVAGSWYGRE